jgi:hypothetical protein
MLAETGLLYRQVVVTSPASSAAVVAALHSAARAAGAAIERPICSISSDDDRQVADCLVTLLDDDGRRGEGLQAGEHADRGIAAPSPVSNNQMGGTFMTNRVLLFCLPALVAAAALASPVAAQGPPRSRYAGALESLDAQRRAEADVTQLDLTPAARLWLVGTWRSNTDGNFVLQFSADGTYTYSHKDDQLRQVAEHVGTWTISPSPRRSESSVEAIRAGVGAWPAIDGAIGRPAQGAGLMVSMQPTSIRVPSSAPPIYLGNQSASFRIAFGGGSDPARPARFRMLHIDQGPVSQQGQLRFTRQD